MLQDVKLPHILMPGHIWKSLLSDIPARFECWVFTDEAGVQQDDIRAQDGFDHLQDLGVFGQLLHPAVLKMDIVEAVLGVLFTWEQKYTELLFISSHSMKSKWFLIDDVSAFR